MFRVGTEESALFYATLSMLLFNAEDEFDGAGRDYLLMQYT